MPNGLGSTLLTFYGDAVDKPGNLRFGFAADSAHQDAGLIGGEDQVPRSADPEWSRCGRPCERMKGGSAVAHRRAPLWLPTFDGDFNDVVYGAQPVCGHAAVVSSVGFHHIRYLECFLEGLEGYSPAGQLSSVLLPGDIWSRPEIQTQLLILVPFQPLSSCFESWTLTYKPSAMHSNSRVSPLRTILVLVDPSGYMNPG